MRAPPYFHGLATAVICIRILYSTVSSYIIPPSLRRGRKEPQKMFNGAARGRNVYKGGVEAVRGCGFGSEPYRSRNSDQNKRRNIYIAH
jgi:hypothetical protein